MSMEALVNCFVTYKHIALDVVVEAVVLSAQAYPIFEVPMSFLPDHNDQVALVGNILIIYGGFRFVWAFADDGELTEMGKSIRKSARKENEIALFNKIKIVPEEYNPVVTDTRRWRRSYVASTIFVAIFYIFVLSWAGVDQQVILIFLALIFAEAIYNSFGYQNWGAASNHRHDFWWEGGFAYARLVLLILIFAPFFS